MKLHIEDVIQASVNNEILGNVAPFFVAVPVKTIDLENATDSKVVRVATMTPRMLEALHRRVAIRAGVSHKEAAALGWQRVDPRPWSKVSACWQGPSGWYLQHCGHPTALWPWALYDAEGELVLAPNRRAWSSLLEVFEYVAELEAAPAAATAGELEARP